MLRSLVSVLLVCSTFALDSAVAASATETIDLTRVDGIRLHNTVVRLDDLAGRQGLRAERAAVPDAVTHR
ncbi:MAG: hypothetical protein KF911_10015 [Pseudomonadales bacterium]|nr:hypothetical protein [Pseudomonadales bacterium]